MSIKKKEDSWSKEMANYQKDQGDFKGLWSKYLSDT